MTGAVRTALGALLLALTVTGCAALAVGPPPTPEQECQRSGGTWRGTRCDFSAGGGGGGGY